jgi:hypothetical protein
MGDRVLLLRSYDFFVQSGVYEHFTGRLNNTT